MSAISTVGLQPIPLEAGAPQARVADPTLNVLLDYYAFWLRWSLNDKIATMTAPAVDDALPTANRYAVNPQSIIVPFHRPALFAWWSGKSVIVPRTTVYHLRQRDVTLMYAYVDINGIDQVAIYSGLMSAVDATLARASYRLGHPEYSYGAWGVGTGLRQMAGIEGLEYMGGQEGFLADLARTSVREPPRANNSKGPMTRGFPALHATVRIWERVQLDTPLDPDDVAQDFPVSIATATGTGEDGVTILERFLEPPDGSEEP